MDYIDCYVCASRAEYTDSLPIGSARFTNEPICVDRKNADIFICSVCGHMMISNVLHDDYYSEAIFTDFATTNYLNEDRKRQIDFLGTNALYNGLFLEIGCGDGSGLELASGYFENIFGVEPSTKYSAMLVEKKIPHINGYFNKNMLSNMRCDAFMSMHVFEHLQNPTEVLKDIFDVCVDGAIGVIEVPDGQVVQCDKKILYIIAEHMNYYTPTSIAFLAYLTGFRVLSISSTKYGNLEIVLRKPVRNDYSYKEQLISLREELDKIKSRYSTISAWGAGAKMVSLIPILEGIKLTYLFDNDMQKHGRYILGSKKEIVKPSKDKVQSSDVILLFGTQYDNEVKNELRYVYNFKGDIVTLDY